MRSDADSRRRRDDDKKGKEVTGFLKVLGWVVHGSKIRLKGGNL
jgi:hypothetical protein